MMTETTRDNAHKYPVTRGLRGTRIIIPDTDLLIDTLCSELVRIAFDAARSRGEFHIALSGGSTPEPLYRRLVIDPRYRFLPWEMAHVWLVDERCVPPDDSDSNYRMIRESVLDHVEIPSDQVHPMPVLQRGGQLAYEKEMQQTLGPEGRFDFVLLGMGSDGHTASLFPSTEALHEDRHWVLFNGGPTVAPPRPRMTLTFPALNAARVVAVLVLGEGKFPTLQRVSLSPNDLERLPITGVDPVHDDGELMWYIDGSAAVGPSATTSE